MPGFCEVAFDDVRLPLDHVLGRPGRGWQVITTVLRAERMALMAPARFEYRLAQLGQMLDDLRIEPGHRARAELATLDVDVAVHRAFTRVLLGVVADGGDPGPLASVSKLLWSRLDQRVAETGLAALGDAAESADLEPFLPRVPPAWQEWPVEYWQARAASIYGGADPVQREVLARSAIGH
ncbi:acyl-CoA dehydrogenase family protein [Nocardioides sp. TF02-7]|uniref:acyl-CoA dehydrogenase family protein n=1 Tax=Nocardioides sp. TF02-7 TaxID=2917724 RepID=UPI0023DCB58B|nr:acyl-CoA dehydrogenase family protein [Nocardioides sp. TF02-7]